MTYAAQDLSIDDGAPYETFEFVVGASSWKYTNHAVDVGEFVAVPIHRGQISQGGGSIGATATIEVSDENPLAVALNAGLTVRPVEVTVRRYHRTDASVEAAVIFKGLVTGISFDGPKASIPCASRFTLASRRRVPWVTYQAGCNLEWAGTRCGVNKATYAVTDTVTQTGRTLTASAAAGFDDGYFSGGWVERADGERRFIDNHTGSSLLLQMPLAAVSALGEEVTLYPGCQRTEEYCASTFNNLPNYLGWSRLPSINPFNRSAYYLGGVTDIPDPGDTWEIPGGYLLVLEDKTFELDPGVAHTEVLTSTLSFTFEFTATGYVKLNIGGMQVTASGGQWVTPKNPTSDIPALFDVYVEDPVITSRFGSHTPGSLVNFASWEDMTSGVSLYGNFPLPQVNTDEVYTLEFTIRIRDKAESLVRAANVLTVERTFRPYVERGGA